jgi:hypothetical protein
MTSYLNKEIVSLENKMANQIINLEIVVLILSSMGKIKMIKNIKKNKLMKNIKIIFKIIDTTTLRFSSNWIS